MCLLLLFFFPCDLGDALQLYLFHVQHVSLGSLGVYYFVDPLEVCRPVDNRSVAELFREVSSVSQLQQFLSFPRDLLGACYVSPLSIARVSRC